MTKHKCKICGKEVSNNNSYIGSHVKRKHKILLNDYFITYKIKKEINTLYLKLNKVHLF